MQTLGERKDLLKDLNIPEMREPEDVERDLKEYQEDLERKIA
jgi:hypothetical protein